MLWARTFQFLCSKARFRASPAVSSATPMLLLASGWPLLCISEVAAAMATASLADMPSLALALEAPSVRSDHTLGVSSAMHTNTLDRPSSWMRVPFWMLSSSHGEKLVRLTPCRSPASRCTAFEAAEGSSAQTRSSRPPLSAMVCNKDSAAEARTFECSLAAPRSSRGSKRALRKRPDCWRPKADIRRPRSRKLAVRHLGPNALDFLALLLRLPCAASPRRRLSIRDISGQAASSRGTRPCSTREHRASAAACCGDAAWLDPPAASDWSSSTTRTSPEGSASSVAPGSWPRSSATKSSMDSESMRPSDTSSSSTASDSTNTLDTLSHAAATRISRTALAMSAGEPAASEKLLEMYVSASQRVRHSLHCSASWARGPNTRSSRAAPASRGAHCSRNRASGGASSSGSSCSGAAPRGASFRRCAGVGGTFCPGGWVSAAARRRSRTLLLPARSAMSSAVFPSASSCTVVAPLAISRPAPSSFPTAAQRWRGVHPSAPGAKFRSAPPLMSFSMISLCDRVATACRQVLAS
mmetsp:Transcript_70456/g.196537  ORF Transcript_70456/g.196537 Transcript_70456/m.196537 type:complete len:527 (+) Transcript_70456:710-2290(+)